MTVIRAMAMRAELPRQPQRSEKELSDLTTLSLQDTAELSMDALHIAPPRKYWTEISHAVPGKEITGTLPDDHHARFVLRLPQNWNGSLVVAAASGITNEFSYDLYFSDYLLLRGYAFAATDKAVRRAILDVDTVILPFTPEGHISRWTDRLFQLGEFSRNECEKYYGKRPKQTIAAGLSNGGYIARRAAETNSQVFDGAIEIAGVLWRSQSNNLLRELPLALRAASAGDPSGNWDTDLLERSGMPDIEQEWFAVADLYRNYYWEAVMHLFLGHFDPDYNGPLEEYDLDKRPDKVLESISGIENSGDLKIPLISLAAERDYLISYRNHALAYRRLVEKQGKQELHKLMSYPDACHIDANAETFSFVRPIMPHAHAAIEELEKILSPRRETLPI